METGIPKQTTRKPRRPFGMIMIPKELKERLKRLAEVAGTPMYAVIEAALVLYEQKDANSDDARTSRTAELRRSLIMVDATPDRGLATRILTAWLDDKEVTDNTAGLPPTSPVLVMMNEHRARRNVMLREAIQLLDQKEIKA